MIKPMGGAETFRFRVGKVAYIGWIAAPSVIIFFAAVALSRHQLDRQTAVFFSVCLAWYVVLGAMFLMQNATLALDSSGLERLVWNVSVRRVDWRNVRRIRQFVLYSRASGENIIWQKVHPKNAPIWLRPFFSGIAFPSRTADFHRLILILNLQASEYKIDIQQKKNGVWVRAAKLSDRLTDFV